MSLADKLTIAATALIGSVNSLQAEVNDGEWNFSASTLLYSEPDRVSAAEFIVNANKEYGDSSIFNFKLVVDSLTGASANGAIEQSTPQTFTRPSGNGQFVIDANNTPLDDTFRDSRIQINASWSDQFTEESRYTIASNISKEYDFSSFSVNGEIAKDFNQKNSTLSVGLSFGQDEYSPEGDLPIAFSSMVIDQGQYSTRDDFWTAYHATRGDASDSISTSEILLGFTQVINRQALMQFNYSYSNAEGYLTDPFKILSVVDTTGNTQNLVYEKRPDSKKQQSIFGLLKYHLDQSIFDISYRYLTNDWEIKSSTLDMHWHFFSDDNSFWEPHVRLYQQDAADFYTPYLTNTTALPEFASADYRIGKMSAYTVGLKYGFQLSNEDKVEIRFEYYKQTPEQANQPQGVSGLSELELYPEVDALILQVNYFF